MIKRFHIDTNANGKTIIKDRQSKLTKINNMEDAAYKMNELEEENEYLRQYILDKEKENKAKKRTYNPTTWIGSKPK